MHDFPNLLWWGYVQVALGRPPAIAETDLWGGVPSTAMMQTPRGMPLGSEQGV